MAELDDEVFVEDDYDDDESDNLSQLEELLEIKDFETMVNDTLESITDADVGITNTNDGSVIRTIIEAILDNVDALNYYIEYVYGAMGIDTATGDDLDNLVALLGIVRDEARYATGVVTFCTGDEVSEYDIAIPYGSVISTRQNNDGDVTEFSVTDTDAVLKAGETELNVNVVAVEAGKTYVASGGLCVLSEPIIGIDSVYNTDEINSGEDKESDDSFRDRAKQIVASFGKSTDEAIRLAVEEIDDVTACTIDDMHDGVGTTGVVVVTKTIPPSETTKENISKAVKSTKASGIKATIIYPTIKTISIVITITGNYEDDTVLSAISSYATSLAVGQTFTIKQMERKVLNALDTNNVDNDDIDIVTSIPSSNISCNENEIIRINTVTINGVIHNV